VALLRVPRERQREARARAHAEQADRLRLTGYAGGHAELGHAVAYELRLKGYSPAIAAYGGHLCAVGGNWNFQGNPRLAQLVGRCLRSAQRYRAQLEADGLLRSYCLEPGDMVDGQRAPVSRPQVVRDLSQLRALALARMVQRPKKPHRRSKAEARAAARAAAVIAPPKPAPLTGEQLQDALQQAAARAPEWLRGPILQGAGFAAAPREKRPPSEPLPEPILSDADLDELDRELRELTEERERERSRAPPPD
jgi:hypothetical protein